MTKRLRTVGVVVTAVIGLAAPAAYAFSYTGGVNTRASVTPSNGDPNGTSQRPRISANGCHVTYQSAANNLVPNDNNFKGIDVFLSSRANCADPTSRWLVKRVSVKAGKSSGDVGSDPNGESTFTDVSGDGRYVTFQSLATDLVAGTTTGTGNIFVRDMSTGVTRIVSHAAGGGRADGYSTRPTISQDGRFITYNSKAANLAPGATHRGDVYVWDRASDTNRRVTVADNGGNPNGESLHAEISYDGTYIAFQSQASNLVAGDTNGKTDVFRAGNPFLGVSTNAIRASVSATGGNANQNSTRPTINGNGKYVAWESTSNNQVSGDTNGVLDVFVRNMATARTTRVSVDQNGNQLAAASQRPDLDEVGDTVVFAANARNVVAGDGNGQRDVFVREYWETPSAAFNKRVSVAYGTENGDAGGCPSGAAAASPTTVRPMARAGGEDLGSRPFMSADGRVIAFLAGFCNLVPNDNNFNTSLDDIFVRDYR